MKLECNKFITVINDIGMQEVSYESILVQRFHDGKRYFRQVVSKRSNGTMVTSTYCSCYDFCEWTIPGRALTSDWFTNKFDDSCMWKNI